MNEFARFYKDLTMAETNLMTTTITLSNPEEQIADSIGFPAVPDGSPSSLDRC